MQKALAGLIIIIGIIHLLPIIGIMGAERLSSLYGLTIREPNLVLLMQHRAVLFGLLGAFFILSAFQSSLQPYTFAGGFISILSFLFLAWISPQNNGAIQKVVMVDIIALICLIAASFIYVILKRQG